MIRSSYTTSSRKYIVSAVYGFYPDRRSQSAPEYPGILNWIRDASSWFPSRESKQLTDNYQIENIRVKALFSHLAVSDSPAEDGSRLNNSGYL
jgi:hypothetical protein